MMSIERITNVVGTSNPRCVTINEALNLGERHDGVRYSLALQHAHSEGKVDMGTTMVPIVDQSVGVHRTGCIPEHEARFTDTRVTIGTCDAEKANRCAGCILNVVQGEAILKSLKPSEFII